ncbi:Uncharacterised protein [Ewingella americana]|uniref:Uncharacterized protein n=1 Tax=Ewingella americana TaxID=41202 RepID=A0A377N6F3_9GAMM|nr:Uncharacterised protein [Ewingella americana]
MNQFTRGMLKENYGWGEWEYAQDSGYGRNPHSYMACYYKP